MEESPIAEDYDRYRLLDGEVVERVDPYFGRATSIVRRPGELETSPARDENLTRPTRLRLQLAGEPDSPGGLLDEGDIREGDYIYIAMGDEIGRVYVRNGADSQILFHHGPGFEIFSKINHKLVRLATPAELRDAGVGPPDANGVSTPEPPPERGDRDVPGPLIAFLEDQGYDDAADLVRERVRFGVEKYGTRLETDNGRDPIEDAKQEIGDALQYLAQAKMEGRDLRELNDLILGALLAVLGEYSG